jgi:very-short-patch-repair endonuclease
MKRSRIGNSYDQAGARRIRTATLAPGPTTGPTRGTATDSLILTLAAKQHGVVAREQLWQAGVPSHRIDNRVKGGWLEPVHAGIYRVAALATSRHLEMAAVLACGPNAALSHESAGVLHEMLPTPVATSPVHVSTTRDVRLRNASMRTYRVVDLRPNELTQLDGLPLTTPGRTLLDLAGSLSPRELERALARSYRLGLLEREQIQVHLALHPRRRGSPRLRALLDSAADPAHTRSEAEERFLTLVRKAELPAPEMNVIICGFEVDALWRMERLVVEIDGFAYHSSSTAFERDRYRDGVLTAAGLRVMRVTWRQLTRVPEALLARLAQALVSLPPG